MDASKMTEITISQYRKGLECKRPMLVYGKSGYGKTAVALEYAEENGLTPVLLNLALELPENVGGLPKVLDEGWFIKVLDKKLQPMLEAGGKDYLLIIDEINQGSPEVFNALYSIVHPQASQRHWNEYPLPDLQIVAMGNLSDGTDGTVYLNDLPTPLENRFFVFKLKPNNKDATDYLKKKHKNIPQVAKYIKVMLDNNVAPRDVDLALEILQYDYDSMFLEAKLGTALTAKIYDIQKGIKNLDPAELLKNARKVYEQFVEDGEVMFGAETITTEEELKGKFAEFLSDEEIAGIIKGVE